MGLDRDERGTYAAAYDWWARWSGDQRGRIPPGWDTVLRDDPLLRTARVVVDLVLAGGQRRVLLGPAFAHVAAGRDGISRRVHGELADEPALTEQVTPGEGGLARRSVSVSVSGRLVRPGAILGTGWPIAGRGEVSLLCEGMSWDHRLVWLRGPVSGGVAFGRDDEFVDLSISDPALASTTIPPWVLDAERWADIDESAVGDRVPIMVGRAILPCPRVDSAPDTFLICYGARSYVLDSAWINGVLDAGPIGVIEETTDALNLPVTTIRFPTGAGGENDEIHVQVAESAANLVGLTLLEGVRRVVEDHDAGRASARLFGEAAARCAQFGPASGGSVPSLVVNDACSLYDWIGNDVFGDHPYLSLVWDGTQVGPVAIDHRSDPVASLGPGVYPVIARAAGARYAEQPIEDLRTGFVLRWNYSPVRDVWREATVRNPANNTLCAMAAAVLDGPSEDRAIEALSIRDEASAGFVLDWLCEHRCRIWYETEVDAYPSAWFSLRLGDALAWTDADVGLADAPALVLARTWQRGVVRLGIRVYPRTWNVGGGSRSF